MDATAIDLLAAALAGLALAAAAWAATRRRAGVRSPSAALVDDARAAAGAAPVSEGALTAAFAARLADMVMHHALNPLWWRDADLNLVGANAAYAVAVGAASPAEAVRQGLELAPGARALAARARASGRTALTEERVVVAGERRLMDIVHVPLGDGSVAGMAFGPDHRPAPQSAREAALADALATVATAVAVFDPQRRLCEHNPAFSVLFGVTEELMGERPEFDRLLDAMRERRRLPETRDFPAWRAARHAWFELAPGASATESWTLPAGEVVRVRARRDMAGGLVLACDDETERVLLAGARDQAAEVQGALLDALAEGVGIFSPDGVLRFFNSRFAEIVALDATLLAAEPTADTVMARVAELLTEPALAAGLRDLIVAATARRETREGRLTSVLGFTFDFRAAPLPDGNAALVLLDVTPREMA